MAVVSQPFRKELFIQLTVMIFVVSSESLVIPFVVSCILSVIVPVPDNCLFLIYQCEVFFLILIFRFFLFFLHFGLLIDIQVN